MVLQPYRCGLCGTNWLLELELLQPSHREWICLYQASSILAPVSANHQRTRSSEVAAEDGQTMQEIPSGLFSQSFSQVDSIACHLLRAIAVDLGSA
ncbi:hypothetical protein [Paraburkholderia sp. DHOC27]|uniref:hypothetical protein n=1 Tax=Paraburkholderia sp. DHOC27 TaxID=2303330 RepID=UPI000E3BE8D1|nr:hypothetical protein [Paraburkholderia sp. DHOC27]RFU44516.1 hypothetical protein D0B32_28360 [Paraburkholderia sp. DHOC27]